MRQLKFLFVVVTAATFFFAGCKPKDSDIKAKVETALRSEASMASANAEVTDGVVTLTGECKDEACRKDCEDKAKGVKGVKSVINNMTLAAAPVTVPPPASVTTVLDDATQQRVRDGLKDIKGVTVAFTGDKAVLTGAVSKADRMKIMQILAAANVQSDVSGLTDK